MISRTGSAWGYLSIFKAGDFFLRRPCDSESYESQIKIDSPFLDQSTLPPCTQL